MRVNGQRILLIGDELSILNSGQPGDLLAQMLAAQGAAGVQVDAAKGRSAVSMWSEPNASGLVAADQAFEPDQVIVLLGSNDLALDTGADGQGFAAIAQAFPKAQLWAVGPPSFNDPTADLAASRVYQTLASVFGAGRVIDMRPLTLGMPRTKGNGFTPDLAPQVGQALYIALSERTPISWGKVALGVLGLGALVGVGVYLKRREDKTHEGIDQVLGAAGDASYEYEPSDEGAYPVDEENAIDVEAVERPADSGLGRPMLEHGLEGSRPRPARVVVYPGDDRHPWHAEMFDEAGNLRSYVSDSLHAGEESRIYVEGKIAEFWPELPVETAAPGTRRKAQIRGAEGLTGIKISTKDPATMTASAVNKELDKLSARSSELIDEFIAAGRGHERPSDIEHMTDPLAVEQNAIWNRTRDLRNEIELRYGPRAPSRFPTGDPKYRGYFKPRKTAADGLDGTKETPMTCADCGGPLTLEDPNYGLVCKRCGIRVAGPFESANNIPEYVSEHDLERKSKLGAPRADLNELVKLPRYEFIANYLALVTRRKSNREISHGLQVKRKGSKWQVINTEVGGGTVTYETADPALLFDYVRRGPLGHFTREADNMRVEHLSSRATTPHAEPP